MIRATVFAGIVVAAGMACAAFGQAAGPLHFEVASIKASVPPPDGKWMVRMRGNPGRLDYSSVSLKAIVQQACEVRDFQVSGPDWMASTRFDVVAKLPAGAPRSKIPEMLRSLLAERFHAAVHRETKEVPMYALVVGKNGIKMKDAEMKEAEVDPNAPAPESAAANNAASNGASALDCGPSGETAVAAGWMINKRGRIEGHAMNMASLVNLLASLLGRPVVDQTGLKGAYDFDLDYSPDDGQRPPAEVQAPSTPAASDPDGPSLLTAVQSQLGLKLDSKKGAVEMIVVDHVEKTPAEN
jgi:uncharacterized protein (TIGR03435 family)